MLFGAARWRARTRDLRAGLLSARAGGAPQRFDPRELLELPVPVRRFFHAALRDGQPVVTSTRLTMEGDFLTDAAKKRWAPFTADQLFVSRPPGFDWDARIRILPGLNVFVRDAYREGAGVLRAEVLGLVTVADLPASPDLAKGELLRWLAEACWFPTALLPSQGVRWEAVAEDRARATLEDHGVTASLEFRFGADGLVVSMLASDRPYSVGAASVPMPWEGTWTAYDTRNGMHVPSAGEVAWLLPEGRLPYWRGRVKSAVYTFADPGPVSTR